MVITVGVEVYNVALPDLLTETGTRVENTIPTSQGISTRVLAGTILFWILTGPGLAIRPHKIRLMFTVKSVIMPFAFWGLFIFCMINGSNGVGNFGPDFIPAKGGKLGWLMLSVIHSTV